MGGDNNRPDNSFVFSRAHGYSLGTVYREYRAGTERVYRRLPANWNREFESAAAKWGKRTMTAAVRCGAAKEESVIYLVAVRNP